MNDRDEVEHQPEAQDEPTPPEEPFAYIKTNPGMAFRSPVSLTVFATVFTCFGAWMLWEGLGVYLRLGLVSGVVIAGSGVVAIAGGSFAIYMGIKRWRWKREYERVMGRSPW